MKRKKDGREEVKDGKIKKKIEKETGGDGKRNRYTKNLGKYST